MSRKTLPIFQNISMLTVYGMLSAIWKTLFTMKDKNSMDGTPVSVPAIVKCCAMLRRILADYNCQDYSDNADNLHNLADVQCAAESLLLDSAFRPLPMRNGKQGKREIACNEIIAVCHALRFYIGHQMRTHHYSRPVEILEASETDLYVADPSAIGLGEIYIRRYKGNQLEALRQWSNDYSMRNLASLPDDLPTFLYQWDGGPWRNWHDMVIAFPSSLRPRYV